MTDVSNFSLVGEDDENIETPVVVIENDSNGNINRNNNRNNNNNSNNENEASDTTRLITEGSPSSFRIQRGKQKICVTIVGVVLVACLVTFFILHSKTNSRPNIIFMISDGYGPASGTFARVVLENDLKLDDYLVGTVRTYSANSWVTDSSASATAYSCGKKTINGYVGVDPDQKPCATLLEGAQSRGYNTGLVVTSRVTHATPAAFSAHINDRNAEELIALQQVDAGIDIVFGGGKRFFSSSGRSDGLDLIKELKDKGYSVIENRELLVNGNFSLPVFGLFQETHIDFDIDRTSNPSLFELLKAALGKIEEPFFLLVEGSRIDMAAHLNDPAALYHEIRAYDAAFDLALQYANDHSNTLVVSTSDHDTGGLSLGWQEDFDSYPNYEWHPEAVRIISKSVEVMADLILYKGQDIQNVLGSIANITVTQEEIDFLQIYIDANNKQMLAEAIAIIENKRCMLGWTTHGHTGVDVNLYAYNAKLSGNIENIDLNSYLQDVIGVDLDLLTSETWPEDNHDVVHQFVRDGYHQNYEVEYHHENL